MADFLPAQPADPAQPAREILRDCFIRIIEHVDDLTDALTDEVSFYRPTPESNSIAWLIWHSARITDAQLAHITGGGQVWETWVDRFDLDLPREDHGYGHDVILHITRDS